VENRRFNRGVWLVNWVEKARVSNCVDLVDKPEFSPHAFVLAVEVAHKMYSRPLFFDSPSTGFAHSLHMQTLLDLGDGFAKFGVETRFFFDLLYGMDGSGVVLAS
jgi:hypothetical protein